MERMLSRFSWMPSIDLPDNINNDNGIQEDEIPLPQQDPTLIDTAFIHWGYANVLHVVDNGADEKWETFWMELCGSSLRLYKDASFCANPASSSIAPVVISPENEVKERTLDLDQCEEDVDSEEELVVQPDNKIDPRIVNLRKQLLLKTDQILQFEAQILNFYGRGKGDFVRDEFNCTTTQDYFLVPGRVETFIPSGTVIDGVVLWKLEKLSKCWRK